MKRTIFVFMAVLTVFAMISCDNGTTTKAPKLYTVSFSGNGSTGGAVPTAIKQKTEGETIALPGNTGTLVKTGFVFVGWSETVDGAVITSYKPTKDTTLHAKWNPDVPLDKGRVQYILNGGSFAAGTPEYLDLDPESAITEPAEPTKANATFDGWYSDIALTTPFDFAATKSPDVGVTLNIYAKWTPTSGGGDPDEIVEEIGLSNGWSAIFQFVLPENRVWEDYKELTVEHKLADATTPVRARMWGNFVESEITGAAFGSYNGKNIAVVGSWPGGSSGRWIWDNTYAGVTAANTMLATAVPPPADNAWFKVKYKIDGTGAHAQWNGHNDAANALAGREPEPEDKGPFYIGVGFSNASATDPAVVSQIKNVTLVGYDETIADLVGTPLYFKSESGALYRAYNGQLDEGNLQGGKPFWNIISGEEKIKAAAIPGLAPDPSETVTITFNKNYTDAPAATTKIIVKGGTLEGTDIAAIVRDGWFFLGWFNAATGGDKAVAADTYDEDTTLYAQWEEDLGLIPDALVIDDPDELADLVEAQGGAEIDSEGYVIMAEGAWNNTDHGNNNDSLLTFKFPDDLDPGFNAVKITYSYKLVEAPDLTPTEVADGWVIDAAGITKNGYGSWSTISGSGNYFSFSQGGGVETRLISQFPSKDGLAIQINKGDDNTNKQKRAGVVYGIKITKIVFCYAEIDAPIIEAKGGAIIDDDGWLIMAESAWNEADHGDGEGDVEADSLLTFTFPSTLDPKINTITVSYTIKVIEAPDLTPTEVTDGWVIDAAGITKNGYGSWSTISGTGNYFSFNLKGGGGAFTRLMSQFPSKDGLSVQINKGDDNTNKQKRAGVVYGIKVSKVVYSYE